MREGKWNGGEAIGTWVQSPNPEACEALAGAGYQFCIIDMEHGAFGWDMTVQLVRATQVFGTQAIVRVLSGDQRSIQKTLDLGADGVLVPKVESGEQAAAIVAACRFPPSGIRGVCGTTRASIHGIDSFSTVIQRSTELHVWALIESRAGVENINDILASGITGVVLGPFDLAFDLGLDGAGQHPDVVEAQHKVLAAANNAGIDCIISLGATEPVQLAEEMRRWRDIGAKTVTVPSDRALLTAAYRNALQACQAVAAQ